MEHLKIKVEWSNDFESAIMLVEEIVSDCIVKFENTTLTNLRLVIPIHFKFSPVLEMCLHPRYRHHA